MAKRLPYEEGSEFLVPLPGGHVARGIVARMAPKGKILLGYFFAPAPSEPSSNRAPLDPADAVLIARFGDLHLIDGKWPVISQVAEWSRSNWPIPEFIRRDPLGFLPDRVVVYSDTDLVRGRAERREVVPQGLASDALMGAGAVEITLKRLLRAD